MKSAAWFGCSLVVLLVGACSDDGVPVDTDSSGGATSPTSGSMSSSATQGDATSPSTDPTESGETDNPSTSSDSAGATGSTGGGSTGGSTGGTTGDSTGATDTGTGTGSSGDTGPDGVGELELEWDSFAFWQNCQPLIAADPVIVQTSIVVRNTTDMTASGVVDSARFIDGDDNTAITFDVDPAETGDVDAGTETTMNFDKVFGSSNVQNMCNTLVCGAPYRVEIVFEDGIQQHVLVTDQENISCPE